MFDKIRYMATMAIICQHHMSPAHIEKMRLSNELYKRRHIKLPFRMMMIIRRKIQAIDHLIKLREQ